ncbi:MAG: hypothetical protein V1799_07655 [bacterium]
MTNLRVYRVKKYDELDELVADLYRCTSWTLCTGFECNGLLLLNDSFSEDGAQEFGVIIPDEDRKNGTQVESITVSWCKPGKFKKIFEECFEYKKDISKAPFRRRERLLLFHGEKSGWCGHCA